MLAAHSKALIRGEEEVTVVGPIWAAPKHTPGAHLRFVDTEFGYVILIKTNTGTKTEYAAETVLEEA